MNKKTSFHGSDLEKISEAFNIKKEDIVNFAANVNPFGISNLLREELKNNIDIISAYPDRDYVALRSSIADYSGVSKDNVVVGNGSTELISDMAKFLKPKNALIIGPTYSEYQREIGLSGGGVEYFELREEDDFSLNFEELRIKLENNYDLLVICNPNNPTSSVLTCNEMEKLFKLCEDAKTFVMVDETYIEFTGDLNKYSCVRLSDKYQNFIVLRGVSKFYAAPGLRLGYAITSNAGLLDTIHKEQDPWSVNVFAERAGIYMYSDTDYINNTTSFMLSEQDRIYNIFKESDKFKAYRPYANFILLKILDEKEDADSLFEKCIKKGCMIRNCSSFTFLNERYIRFCFMKKEDNDRLISILLD